MNTELSAEQLRELLEYDPVTGVFTRRADLRGHQGRLVQPAGFQVGGADEKGYIRIRIQRVRYKAHRLAVLYMTGVWPLGEVDHINHNPSDNRWENLRDVSRAVNQQNQIKANAVNKTGFFGVRPYRSRFVAQIRYEGKTKHIGVFDTPQEAHAAYVSVKRQVHPGCTI